jgi:hypothetical protein
MGHGIIVAAEMYGGIGAVVAAWFLFLRIERDDAMARNAYAFRPLLVPGLVMLWPLVLWRVTSTTAEARSFRRAHLAIWGGLAVLLPLVVLASLALRQNGPTEAPPVRLSPP